MLKHPHKPFMIIISGPTGVGKSELACRIAEALSSENLLMAQNLRAPRLLMLIWDNSMLHFLLVQQNLILRRHQLPITSLIGLMNPKTSQLLTFADSLYCF